MDDRKMNYRRIEFRALHALIICIATVFSTSGLQAQQPNWIWSPKQPILASGESQGECFFRKKFTLVRPESAELHFAAGDEYEIYINGQTASRGMSYGKPSTIDVSPLMQPGVNLVAVKVRHNQSENVGIAIRLRVKEKGESRWRSLTTDGTWKTRLEFVQLWKKGSHNDMGWLKAQTLGAADVLLTATEKSAIASNQAISQSLPQPNVSNSNVSNSNVIKPQQNQTAQMAKASQSQAPMVQGQVLPISSSKSMLATKSDQNKSDQSRFEVDPEFTVEPVLGSEETGSLIAMEINEFGQLLLAKEGGPLLIADPTLPLNHQSRIRVYCSEVTSCQGILALNGGVYVTGDGPDGLGVYYLVDNNRDGVLEVSNKLVGFKGSLGEHGPHGLQLGPDGMLYVVVGNGTQVDQAASSTSPYKHWYEGDLVPRYEDPGGHAQGVKAPGGTVVRMRLDGTEVETVAGGIRNAYDLVFDERGELFIHDSDMESDMGTTWYRPTMVYHVPHGAEFGWRSGWSKFPQHFIDQTPAVCETGRGSPTGAVLYQHMQFPARYHNTIFMADWSEGRILALRKQPSGAGFVAQTEVFLKGRPLNVCDMAVAEDGGLYFCTGGRGTAGGVYRVVWNGRIPDKMLSFESDLAKVIRHPQPNSAWARQSLVELKNSLGDKWASSIEGVAQEARNPSKFRIRAMQMMVLYGPTPSTELLAKLVKDPDAGIRAQAARLCGLTGDNESAAMLSGLVGDESPLVRRIAAEECIRAEVQPDLKMVVSMLQSADRIEAMSARRLLERMPAENWEEEVLSSEDNRTFIQGAVALMTAHPSLERAYKVLAQGSKVMDGFVNDEDFVALLRAMELALMQGNVEPSRVPGFADRIENEFPSGSSKINQELARLMAYLKVSRIDQRISDYLSSEETSIVDRVHVAMYLQTIGSDLSDDLRFAIIDCLELARSAEGTGGSYRLYLQRAVEDVSQSLTAEQAMVVLENGARWPNAAAAAFYKLPNQLDQATVERVINLDRSLQGNTEAGTQQLRLGVIAVLARSGGGKSMEYLRELWQTEESRRNDIVIGLSQRPAGENWAYLVSSLPVLDDMTSREVIQKLVSVPRRPREPEFFRSVIEVGYRLRSAGSTDVVRLLEHWSGEQLQVTQDSWQARLGDWKQWYETKWPDQQKIDVAGSKLPSRYSVNQILGYLETEGLGDANRGGHLFTKAQCATCHQMGTMGQNVGPDLTSLAQRFSTREILESTLDPSKVVADRYSSKIVLTADGKQFNGMAINQSDGAIVVLQSDGKRVRIPAEDIEAVKPSAVSAMPTGLLDGLSESEVADLMAFLMQRANATAKQAGPSVESVVR